MTTTTTTDGDFTRTAELQAQIRSDDAGRFVRVTLLRNDTLDRDGEPMPVVGVSYQVNADEDLGRRSDITQTWTATRPEQDALAAWTVFKLLTLRAQYDEAGYNAEVDETRMVADGLAATWLEDLA